MKLAVYANIFAISGQTIAARCSTAAIKQAADKIDFTRPGESNQTDGSSFVGIEFPVTLRAGSAGGQPSASTLQFAAFCDTAISDDDVAKMLG